MSRARAVSPLGAVLVVLLLAGSLPAPLRAADASELTQRRADLQDVQRRIRELERAIADTESTRSAAAEKLAAAERAVSAANRQLRQLAAEREAVERELASQEHEQRAVELRIAERQAELAQWLRGNYIRGGNEVAPLLSARDPNQLARDAYYLERLARARAALIEALRSDLREQARLVASITARRDRLATLEAEQRRQRTEFEKVQAARARALAEVARQLEGQQKEAQALRQDERQLSRVLTVLARQAAQREAARREAERRAAAAAARAAAPASAVAPAARPPVGGRSEPVVGEVRQLAGPSPTGVRFAQLRGQIGFPVRGELVGRFGAQRAQGGTRWRGVFIRARGGDDVVAVAAGEVVFSDWLRGYGNLIILDHGDDYLTIYGNNDALFKTVGERVGGGVPIASVGASGSGQESGLYFEIRHKGEPVDPMLWIRNR